ASPMPPPPVAHLDAPPPAAPPAANPDREEAVLNANVVLRWEWRLGSTLYLVYARSQSQAVDLAPGENARLDVGAAFRGAAADVFLVKGSVWAGEGAAPPPPRRTRRRGGSPRPPPARRPPRPR